MTRGSEPLDMLDLSRDLLLHRLVARRSRETPDHPAVVAGGRTLTYADLDERTDRLASALQAHGVKRGDNVALLMANRAEFIEIVVACHKVGACAVPINFRLVGPEVTYILENSEAVALFTDAAGAAIASAINLATPLVLNVDVDSDGAFDRLVSEHGPLAPGRHGSQDDLAFILYTSGTTGAPKGAMLSHLNLWMQTAAWVRRIGATEADVWMSGVPLFHTAAINALLPMFMAGGTFVVSPSTPFDPEQTIDLLRDNGVTMCAFVPTQWESICVASNAHTLDTKVIRKLFSGAGHARPELLELVMATFPAAEILNAYGQTEMAGSSIFLDGANMAAKTGSVGTPNPEVECAILDEEGNHVKRGEAGELAFRGPGVMMGYYRNPDETAHAFRHGWYHTGDVARQDDDGFYYIVDRVKDMIISGGENIYPAEIEVALATLPGVQSVAVIGAPHPRWVESPVAVIVRTDPELDEATVEAWCRQRLAGYKIPRKVVFVDDVPRNAMGKVLKRQLRDTFTDTFND